MYQRYQALVKQFILKATKRALRQLCQASAFEKHPWATEESDLCKHTLPSFQLQAQPVPKVTNHH